MNLSLKCLEENADIYDELGEKHDYVCNLEEANERLNEECRKLSDMQASWKDKNQSLAMKLRENHDHIFTLEEAKERLDEECRKLSDMKKSWIEVISSVKELAGTAIVYSAKLEGFSSNLLSPSSWSENLEYITQFIEHANEELLRLQTSTGHQVSAEAITPKAKGSNRSISVMNFASQHLDMLDELKNTKNAIENILSSPKLTPMKSGGQDENNIQRNEEYDEDFLYSELLRAHEQLEKLSKKIEAFQAIQMQWEDRESYLQSRIVELEQGSPHDLLETEQARLKEAGVVLMCNFQQRYQRSRVDQAFQTWSSQARMSKHMTIAREMAKELVKTRKKVLLLKSHLDESFQ